MPKITIVRPYEWFNQESKTNIYIDGEKIGHVGIDQIAQFEVSPEKHKIVFKQRWSGGSKPLVVDLSDNKNITIKIKSFKYNWLIFIILFPLINSTYLTLIDIDNFMIKVIGNFLVAGLIYVIVYILFLRTGFIRVEEVEVVDSKQITKEEQARLISKIMEADERDGLYDM